jgi:hypothetical protein
MFYYIEVHLLAHYIQWIKTHGETVKIEVAFSYDGGIAFVEIIWMIW